MNRTCCEPDPGSSAEARPHDRRVWSGGSHGSVMGIPDLHGLGNAPESRDGHVIEPSAQPFWWRLSELKHYKFVLLATIHVY